MNIDIHQHTISEIRITSYDIDELSRIERLYFDVLCKFFLEETALLITIGAAKEHSVGYEMDHFNEIKIGKVKYLVNRIDSCSSSMLKEISDSEEFKFGLLLLIKGEAVLSENVEEFIKYVHYNLGVESLPGKLNGCEGDGNILRLYNMNLLKAELQTKANSLSPVPLNFTIMNGYYLNIPSEPPIKLSLGKVYLINRKTEVDRKKLLLSDEAVYLNYPFAEAQKIIPFFEKISIKDRSRIVDFFYDVFGIQLRLDDMFGKLMVGIFYILEKHDLVIVGLVGLSYHSIETCIQLVSFLTSCSQSNDCAKDLMSNSKFVYLNENGIYPNSYFVFGDTTYKEYADDTLYSTGMVVWNSCDKYSLIVKDARYNTNEWVNPGDTIHVEIISSDKDTVLCVVRAFNASMATKLLKAKQPR